MGVSQTFSANAAGSFVEVQILGRNERLQLAEVQVFGEPISDGAILEPSTFALLASALGNVALLRYRRNG